MSPELRTFIAIDIPDELREVIAGVRKALEGVARRVAWVRQENIHLTLKFLGEVGEARLPVLKEALEGVSEGASPFELRSNGLGGFPSLRCPRVIYLGLEECPGLITLKSAIEKALATRDFPADERPFRGHLTLCRLRSPGAGRAMGEAAGTVVVEKKVAFVVNRFVLYKSELTPRGARYSVIRDFTLQADGTRGLI